MNAIAAEPTPAYTQTSMQLSDLNDLNAQFGLPGVLHFEPHGELIRAQITLPSCAATVYLQGAHVTHWQPSRSKPILFLSSRSRFEPGKAIRGGIPICFPWFGPRGDNKPGPSHGFARIQPWSVAAAALLPTPEAPDQAALHLTLTLAPTDLSRSFGFDNFRVACEFIFADTLTLRLSVVNAAETPLVFEEALHAYFHIAEIDTTQLTGLESALYLDKTDRMQPKHTPPEALTLTGHTDRVFPNTTNPVTIHDPGHRRTITNAKTNSATTIVWNPWSDGAATLPDLGPEDWLRFVCVETANTGADAVTLAPNQARTMQTEISLRRG